MVELTQVKKKSKYIELAEAFMQLAISRIKEKLYAFIPVLNMMEFVPVEENVFICTNGEKIFYNPDDVIEKARLKEWAAIEKIILHILFHGLLGHFENTNWKNEKLSQAVQDIQVNRCVRKMYPGRGDDGIEEMEWDAYICDELYYLGLKDTNIRKRIYRRAEKAKLDNHRYWSKNTVKTYVADGVEGGETGIWMKARTRFFGGKVFDASNIEKEVLKRLEAEKGEKTYGHASQNMENIVTYTKESSMCYKELLDRISQLNEVVKEEQELDKVLYQYGLELYDDVPLIELEEISERHCLHTIVVAVDTSGSCTCLAPKFLREIVAVFEEIKRIGKVEHICYLECDTRITMQKDYYDLQSFIDFGKKHTFIGGGGTSFVPVFEHTDKLAKAGEQVNALIYITDARGEFPEYEERPEYEVYLLLDMDEEWIEDKEYWMSMIPKWAEGIPLYSE